MAESKVFLYGYIKNSFLQMEREKLKNNTTTPTSTSSNGGEGNKSSKKKVVSRYALPPLEVEKQLCLEERLRLCSAVGTEIINPVELEALLARCPNPVAYDGFEPSGRMHIAQGLLKATNVNRLTRSGFTFLFWVADWFAFLNHKMGGDLDKIQTVGKYFVEVWKAAGMDMSRVRILWASEE